MENKTRILAKNVEVSNDTRKTRLNNNDVIIGPSGAGKTSGYVIPNINQHYGSMIIADTKGDLARRMEPSLKEAGYQVQTLDFVNQKNSCSYNPLAYISRDRWGVHYNQKELISMVNLLVPRMDKDEPFWEESAKTVLVSLIAFVLEALPEEEQHLGSVVELFRIVGTDKGENIFGQWEQECPDSFAVKKYKMYRQLYQAERTWSCVRQFAAQALDAFDYEDSRHIFCHNSTISFEKMGKEKHVLFVNVSDTDRSFDRIVNLFYSQALQALCKAADKSQDSRLPVPVRIIMDDFATNVCIPHFDKIMSVIRSREISVSIILQNLAQLNSMYSEAEANTIINNCDHMLYLGGQDLKTAEYISARANRTVDSILGMGLEQAYLFVRGERPKLVEKVNPFEKEASSEEGDFGKWGILEDDFGVEELPFS